MAEIIWRSAPIVAHARTQVTQGMERATQLVVDHIKRLLNRSQPTKTLQSGRRVGLDPSKEGEPPKRLESQLIQGITREVVATDDVVIGRVGTNLAKARRLELGFSGTDSAGRNIHQGPRPFLRRGLAEKKDDIRQQLGGKG